MKNNDFISAYENNIKLKNDHCDLIESHMQELKLATTWPDKWAIGMKNYDAMGRNMTNDKFYPWEYKKQFDEHPDRQQAQDLSDRFVAACNRSIEVQNAWHKVSPIVNGE